MAGSQERAGAIRPTGVWQIEFSTAAAREFRRLVPEIRTRLTSRIDVLASNPHPPGAKRLAGEAFGYRIRVGDYRVLYEVQPQRHVVLVVKVGHRRDVYR